MRKVGVCVCFAPMPFSEEQMKVVTDILNAKITPACPGCGQENRRQVMPEVFVIPGRTPQPLTATPGLTPTPGTLTPVMATVIMPCVVTVCTNCGYVEFYNVHTLGLAGVLGVAAPGQPLR